MTAKPPEGPKADFSAEEASESRIPRPPTKAELDQVSEQQGMITDEWTGEAPEGDRAGKG